MLSAKAYTYYWSVVTISVYLGYKFFNWLKIQDISIFALGFLVFLGFFAEIYEVDILAMFAVSVSSAVYIGSILIGGTAFALTVTGFSLLLSEIMIRGEGVLEGASIVAALQRVSFNIAQNIIAIVAAGLTFALLAEAPATFGSLYDYIPPLIAFSVYVIVNTSLVSGMISLTQGAHFFYQLKFNLRNLHVQLLSLGVLSILVAIAYKSSPWNLLLVAVLLFLVNSSLKSYMELRKQAKQTFERIMNLLSKRDPYTHEHSESVGNLTEAIAGEMKISPDRKEDIVSAARVHDIGKLGIPDSVLLKNGDLTEEEWETMKEHPVLGADILSGLTIYENSVDIVRYEHERWDGSGYPDGLEGENIPLGSRIVAVADVWNALTTKRPYRGPLPEEEARKEMEEMAGVKLDQEVVDALFEVLDSDKEVGTG